MAERLQLAQFVTITRGLLALPLTADIPDAGVPRLPDIIDDEFRNLAFDRAGRLRLLDTNELISTAHLYGHRAGRCRRAGWSTVMHCLYSTHDQHRHHEPAATAHQDQRHRTPFAVDRDRIAAAAAFERLAGVTQIDEPRSGRAPHHRHAHSLAVTRLGRRLAAADDLAALPALQHLANLTEDSADHIDTTLSTLTAQLLSRCLSPVVDATRERYGDAALARYCTCLSLPY